MFIIERTVTGMTPRRIFITKNDLEKKTLQHHTTPHPNNSVNISLTINSAKKYHIQYNFFLPVNPRDRSPLSSSHPVSHVIQSPTSSSLRPSSLFQALSHTNSQTQSLTLPLPNIQTCKRYLRAVIPFIPFTPNLQALFTCSDVVHPIHS